MVKTRDKASSTVAAMQTLRRNVGFSMNIGRWHCPTQANHLCSWSLSDVSTNHKSSQLCLSASQSQTSRISAVQVIFHHLLWKMPGSYHTTLLLKMPLLCPDTVTFLLRLVLCWGYFFPHLHLLKFHWSSKVCLMSSSWRGFLNLFIRTTTLAPYSTVLCVLSLAYQKG